MHVLHCFDKYLNSTMNWAYRLISNTPGVQCSIAAPLLVKNQFYDPRFTYYRPAWQWENPPDEWSFSVSQRMVSRLLHPLYWRRVFSSFQGSPPDIVHAHFAPVGCAVMDLARRHQIPLITSFYGADYEKLPFLRPAYLGAYRQLFALATRLLCEGEHGASILRKMGCPPEKIRIAPLGIEVERLPVATREKLPGRLRLLQAATITAKKGYMTTLEAFRQALPGCPNLTLCLAGEKVDRELVRNMRSFIAAHRLEDRITWLDFIDSRRFYDFLAGFDVFIHPSCYAADRDCEGGAPIVLLDAQATGMPVIATTHCDIPAEVRHGQTGLLAPEGDVATLAAHIGRFYRMGNAEYQSFSRNARTHVESRFDVKKQAANLSAVYAETTTVRQP